MSWPVVPLRRVFRIVNGGTPSGDESNWGGSVEWATPVDLARRNGRTIENTERRLTKVGLETGSRQVPPHSLILSTRAPIGYIAENVSPMAFNQGCRGLVPKTAADTRYFRYQLSALTERLQTAGQGSTFVELSTDGLAETAVCSPPLTAQRAIADCLDTETARIDALITKKRHLIKLLEERASVFVAQVTSGTSKESVVKVASQVDWKDEMPAKWSRAPLKSIFEFCKGVDSGRLTAEYIGANPGKYAVYSGQTKADGLMGTIDTFDFDLPSSAILVSTVGANAMTLRSVTGRFSLSQNCALLVPLAEHTPVRFFYHQLKQIFEHERAKIPADMQPSLRIEDLRQMWVLTPTDQEVGGLEAQADREWSRLEELQGKLSHQIELLKERHQALITAAVTGELEVPGVAA